MVFFPLWRFFMYVWPIICADQRWKPGALLLFAGNVEPQTSPSPLSSGKFMFAPPTPTETLIKTISRTKEGGSLYHIVSHEKPCNRYGAGRRPLAPAEEAPPPTNTSTNLSCSNWLNRERSGYILRERIMGLVILGQRGNGHLTLGQTVKADWMNYDGEKSWLAAHSICHWIKINTTVSVIVFLTLSLSFGGYSLLLPFFETESMNWLDKRL